MESVIKDGLLNDVRVPDPLNAAIAPHQHCLIRKKADRNAEGRMVQQSNRQNRWPTVTRTYFGCRGVSWQSAIKRDNRFSPTGNIVIVVQRGSSGTRANQMAASQSVVRRVGCFDSGRIVPLLIVTSTGQCKKCNEIPSYRRVCEFCFLRDLNLHTQILGPE